MPSNKADKSGFRWRESKRSRGRKRARHTKAKAKHFAKGIRYALLPTFALARAMAFRIKIRVKHAVCPTAKA